ncbi:hypothetical protein PoB_004647700 [Plakobranchus ocellatus]|uniref:Uncharacterized protein n=1 Tax=Plakobranchus ocellatus TaxID=259542 RepID=A0AAV4BKY5_9GAST|nr:hypothetical protein PoB_004647700 [Plakobranchus ocellatus]
MCVCVNEGSCVNGSRGGTMAAEDERDVEKIDRSLAGLQALGTRSITIERKGGKGETVKCKKDYKTLKLGGGWGVEGHRDNEGSVTCMRMNEREESVRRKKQKGVERKEGWGNMSWRLEKTGRMEEEVRGSTCEGTRKKM